MTLEFTVIGEPIPKGSTKAFGYYAKNRATGQLILNKHGKPVLLASTSNANPRTKEWQHLVADAASRALQAPLANVSYAVTTDPVRVDVVFYLPRPKSLPKKVTAHLKAPDVDKLARAVLDALTNVAWRDDSQVVGLFVSKAYAAINESPRAWVRVTSVPGLVPIVLPQDQPLFSMAR